MSSQSGGSPVPSWIPVDFAQARAALEDASRRAAALVSSVSDPALPIPGSDWTVSDAAAHMVIAARVYVDCARGGASPVDDYTALAELNARLLTEFGERRTATLAEELLVTERAFLAATADRQGDELIPFHEGQLMPAATATCLALGELLTHGYDIARALGVRWAIRPAHARLVATGVSPIVPRLVDEAAAAGVQASYAIHLRGGPRFVYRFRDGELAVLPPPAAGSVDVQISADPVAFLLVAYGRISQWRPILRGQMLAWGRRPWLAFGFKRLLRNP